MARREEIIGLHGERGLEFVPVSRLGPALVRTRLELGLRRALSYEELMTAWDAHFTLCVKYLPGPQLEELVSLFRLRAAELLNSDDSAE